MTNEPEFLTPDRSEGVEMAVDTRRARGTRLRVAQRSRRGQICRRSRLGVRNAGYCPEDA